MSEHPLIRRAVDAVGTQAKLAEASGIVQQHISRLLNGSRPITAEAAVAIERATGGVVSRHELRPDLWPAPFVTQDGTKLARPPRKAAA